MIPLHAFGRRVHAGAAGLGFFVLLEKADAPFGDEFARRVERMVALLALALRDRTKVAESVLAERLASALATDNALLAADRLAGPLAHIPIGAGAEIQRDLLPQVTLLASRARRAAARHFGLSAAPDLTPQALGAVLGGLRVVPEALASEFRAMAVRGVAELTAIITRGRVAGWTEAQFAASLQGFARDLIRRTGAWSRIATALANQTRTGALLDLYQQSGVQRFRVVSLRDEKTCARCWWLHGQVFTVGPALDRLRRGHSLATLREELPFLQEGVDAHGAGIFLRRGGARHRVGRIAGPHEIVDAVDSAELEGLGVGPPPFHPHCRCYPEPV